MLRGFALDSLFKDAAKGVSSGTHPDKCDCGCIPNVMSLHDQARERARRRQEKAAAAAAAAAATEGLLCGIASDGGNAKANTGP